LYKSSAVASSCDFLDIFFSNVQNRFVCLFAFCFNFHLELKSPLALWNMIFCWHIMFSLIYFPNHLSQSTPFARHVTQIKMVLVIICRSLWSLPASLTIYVY
jgi:hypothetical protein